MAVEWHGDRAKAAILAEVAKRLHACGTLGVAHAQQLVSVDGTAKAPPTRDTNGRFVAGKLRYNANPSKPGDPWNTQTGQGRSSIAHEVSGLTVRIGSNLKKILWLELGTSRMAARPVLRRMLMEKMNAFRSILAAPIKGPHR